MKTLIFITALLFNLSVRAEDPSGKAILEKQRDLQTAKSEEITQKMVLVDKSGKKEERKLKTYTKETSEKNVFRTMMVFLEPADIKGTTLLTWQHKGQPDDQWLYLPAQKKMQRIAKGSQKNYFMGTDFTYEDLQKEELDSNNYKVTKTEKVQDADCYVIEAVPGSDEKLRDSMYSKRIIWVSKANFSTLKIEFYDKRNKLMKTQESRELKNVGSTAWRAEKGLMDNLDAGHKTLIGLIESKINATIDDKIFTENYILSGAHIK